MRRTSSRKRYRWALAALALIVVGLGFWWARSSNQATIDPHSVAQKAATPVGYKEFESKYISFRYNGEYIVQTLQAQPPDLELSMLSADTDYVKQLAVSVTTGSAQQSSAYILRQSEPNTYAAHQLSVDGSPATIWVKDDGTEQTAFIPHGNKFAMLSFSVTGTNATGGLTPEVNSLLASFHWQ